MTHQRRQEAEGDTDQCVQVLSRVLSTDRRGHRGRPDRAFTPAHRAHVHSMWMAVLKHGRAGGGMWENSLLILKLFGKPKVVQIKSFLKSDFLLKPWGTRMKSALNLNLSRLLKPAHPSLRH